MYVVNLLPFFEKNVNTKKQLNSFTYVLIGGFAAHRPIKDGPTQINEWGFFILTNNCIII